ncbi:hypothetical protein [Gudongella sp. SC589]|uniref:hypothetical protein n=1 Tax=Gudongella sp. SC589 TaxID=3385990 RepID=UPI00390496A0
MKNELQQITSHGVPTNQKTVNQYGDKNVHVDHADNIHQTVNFNFIMRTPGGKRESVSQTISTDYYNLFVIAGETFEHDHFLVPKNRALIKGNISNELFERLSSLTPEAIEEIKTFPSLFASENTDHWGRTDPEQEAIYGIVRDIRVQDNGIMIYYKELNYIPQHKINEISFNLGMGHPRALVPLNTTQWTIKKINLIEALTDAGISVLAPT